MRSQSGMVTTDFLFAIVVAFGLLLSIFAICFGLTVTEVTQYIAFSTSRAYNAGDKTIAIQRQNAEKKYTALINHAVLKPLYNNGWFSLPPANAITIGDLQADYPGDKNSPFVGVRLELKAPIFNISVPFLGKAFDNDDDLKLNVTSFITREPNFDECRTQIETRHSLILQLDSRWSSLNGNSGNQYVPMEDNGC